MPSGGRAPSRARTQGDPRRSKWPRPGAGAIGTISQEGLVEVGDGKAGRLRAGLWFGAGRPRGQAGAHVGDQLAADAQWGEAGFGASLVVITGSRSAHGRRCSSRATGSSARAPSSAASLSRGRARRGPPAPSRRPRPAVAAVQRGGHRGTVAITLGAWHAERSAAEGLQRGPFEGLLVVAAFAVLGRVAGARPSDRARQRAGVGAGSSSQSS